MIVVEGVDAAGKSTLIKALMSVLPGYRLQESEGPPKQPGEMNDRVRRYLYERHPIMTIYDRHPCVSQIIYGRMRTHFDPISPHLLAEFYTQKPLFIYCDGTGMSNHQINPATDTPEHIEALKQNYGSLLNEYRGWAIRHAHIMYRIGDSVSRVIDMVEAFAAKGGRDE